MSYSLDEKAIIFIDGFLNLEYKYKRAILDLFEKPSDLFTSKNTLFAFLRENKLDKYVNSIELAINEDFVSKIIQKYNERGVKVVTEVSTLYPTELKNLPLNPICLYVKGNENLLNVKNKFSIVGSRKTLTEYLNLTEKISESLSLNGIVIVTGVAVGGDLSAIKGAINSGNLILVMAGGLDYIKSEVNRDYITKTIEKGGLVITEYPPEVPTLAYHYLVRNRIIAGLSKGTLIVSGNYKSGVKYTSNFAIEYNKEVFAYPYTLGTYGSEIPNALIKDGAYMVTELKDITEVLGYNLSENKKVKLTEDETKVLEVIKNGKNLVDDIILELGFKINELLPILTALEIKGVIVKRGGNEFTVI